MLTFGFTLLISLSKLKYKWKTYHCEIQWYLMSSITSFLTTKEERRGADSGEDLWLIYKLTPSSRHNWNSIHSFSRFSTRHSIGKLINISVSTKVSWWLFWWLLKLQKLDPDIMYKLTYQTMFNYSAQQSSWEPTALVQRYISE